MKIEKINLYQVDLPVNEGSYNFADGKAVSVFDSTVVEVITDSGSKGYGEVSKEIEFVGFFLPFLVIA